MSEKIQLNLFEKLSDPPEHPYSRRTIWLWWLNDEITLDQWSDLMNHFHPLTPEELERLSSRRIVTGA